MRYSNKLEHNGTKGYINILKEIRRGGLSNEAIETESFERIYPMIRTAYNKAKKQADEENRVLAELTADLGNKANAELPRNAQKATAKNVENYIFVNS